DAARIAGVDRRSGLQGAYRAICKFERCDESVFGLDLVQSSLTNAMDGADVAKKPKQQVGGVNGLINQSAAAIKVKGAAPMRVGVVAFGTKPLHARIGENGFAEHPGVHPDLDAKQVGFETVLKKDA